MRSTLLVSGGRDQSKLPAFSALKTHPIPGQVDSDHLNSCRRVSNFYESSIRAGRMGSDYLTDWAIAYRVDPAYAPDSEF